MLNCVDIFERNPDTIIRIFYVAFNVTKLILQEIGAGIYFMFRKAVLIIVILLANNTSIRAQDISRIEDSLLYYYKQVKYKQVEQIDDVNKTDSLIYINNRLFQYLYNVCLRYPGTLSYNFKKLKAEGLSVITSDDNRFRIYCWDSWFTRPELLVSALIQYREGNNIKIEVIANMADTAKYGDTLIPSYKRVYHIQTKDRKNVYLLTSLDVVGGSNGLVEIDAMMIQEGKVKNYPFFKEGENMLSSIDYCLKWGYDYKFSKDMRILYIPCGGDERGHPQYFVYKFDGYDFVFKDAK